MNHDGDCGIILKLFYVNVYYVNIYIYIFVARRISCLSVLVILKARCDAEPCNRNGLKGGGALLNYKAGEMVIINVALRYEAVPTPFQLSQQA
jgi:hypothetical protein